MRHYRKRNAVFDAFFDMRKIKRLCDFRGLTFIHHMHILPGDKIVRILGVTDNTLSYHRVTITDAPNQAKDSCRVGII